MRKIKIALILSLFFICLSGTLCLLRHFTETEHAFILENRMSVEEIKSKLTHKNIAIFSGTMNPPTLAHEEIIDRLRNMKNADGSLRFDYVYIHVPEQAGHWKPEAAPYNDRLNMCHHAFEKKNRVLLSKRTPLDTVKILMNVLDLKITYIIGADGMDWMKVASDKGEAEFFKGHTEPQSMIVNPETAEKIPFTGRAIYELKAEKIIILNRAGNLIPPTFLTIPTEEVDLSVNR